jgi:hypothetical protein
LNWDGHKTIFEDGTRRCVQFGFSRIDGQFQIYLQAIITEEAFGDDLWMFYGHGPYDTVSCIKVRRIYKLKNVIEVGWMEWADRTFLSQSIGDI